MFNDRRRSNSNVARRPNVWHGGRRDSGTVAEGEHGTAAVRGSIPNGMFSVGRSRGMFSVGRSRSIRVDPVGCSQ